MNCFDIVERELSRKFIVARDGTKGKHAWFASGSNLLGLEKKNVKSIQIIKVNTFVRSAKDKEK